MQDENRTWETRPAENTAAADSHDFLWNTPEEKPVDPFGDTVPVPGFLTLPEEGLAALCREWFPAMRTADLRFCREYYRRESRVATYGELRMLEALVAERRAGADGYVMSRIRIADETVAATYEDMMTKCRALYPERKTPFTVAEMAQISGAYMHRIGRGDDRFARVETAPPTLLPGTAFLLLTPASEGESGAYEEHLADFLTSDEIAPLYAGTHRVMRYGILGTLASLGNGVFADVSLLPREEGASLCLCDLVRAHRGRMMLSATRANAAWLCRYAERYGLRATYFAKVTETGRWRTSREVSPSIDLSCSFLQALLRGMDLSEVALPGEELRAVCGHTPLAGSTHAPAQARYAVTLFATPEENCFSAAMNLALDAVLRLVSRGVDRRLIGLSLSYGFPRYETSEQEMGKNLSTILGAYRVTMELAAPEFESSVDYIRGGRRLLCTAYTSYRGNAIPGQVTGVGGRIGYLSFRRTEAGVPDFESFRQMCDLFGTWCAEGKVLSACGVTGDALSAMEDLQREGLRIERGADAGSYQGVFCQGILFEHTGIPGVPELGRVVAAEGTDGAL